MQVNIKKDHMFEQQLACECYNVTTMGDKSVETLCHFRVLKANFFSNLYNTTPSPLLNVEFPVSRICLFLVQH